MAQYQFTYNSRLLIEAAQRFSSPRPSVVGSVTLVLAWLAAIYMALIGVSMLSSFPKTGFELIAPFLFVVGMHLATRFIMKRRLRAFPLLGVPVLIEISEVGYRKEEGGEKREIPWSAFTKAQRAKGGFIVYAGDDKREWWPDWALRAGSRKEVEQMLQARVGNYVA